MLLRLWLVVDRGRFALDNARWHRVRWPVETSSRQGQRLSEFGFALFGALCVGVGAYVIALAARIT
jgi:hypothetical protein